MIMRLACLLSLVLAALAAPPARAVRAQAQTVEPTVVHVAAEPFPAGRPDRLRLTVYFSLRDEQGRPVLQGSEGGMLLDPDGIVSLLQPVGPDVPATVGNPGTPLNLLLLVDTSGSMAGQVDDGGERRTVLDDVKDAAATALQSTPSGAKVAVARFDALAADQPLTLVQGLTADPFQTTSAIQAIPAPRDRAITCLFNAAYQGVEYLRTAATSPKERRAILLFTDGRDDNGDGGGCSTWIPEAVSNHARANGTTIYTIGLCSDERCGNTDGAVLEQIARETSGVAGQGTIGELGDLFKQVMDELNSQWAIQADVYPRQGENLGLLRVQAGERAFSQQFSFQSDRDYNAPPTFQLIPTYNDQEDRYDVAVEVINPENLEQATLEVWSQEGGTRLRSLPIAGPGAVQVSTEGMQVEQEYILRVLAVARGGVALSGPEGSRYVAAQTVRYEPQLAFGIRGAEADWEDGQLLVSVSVRGAGGAVPVFNGEVTNEQAEILIPVNKMSPDDQGRLVLAMPDSLLRSRGEQKLRVRLALDTGAAVVEGEAPFSITRPADPISWTPILFGLALLASGAYGAVLLSRRRPGVGGGLAPAPLKVVHGSPSRALGAAPGAPRLRLRVVSSPDQTEVTVAVVTSFPCVVGAGTSADFVVRGDPTVSRAHLQITYNAGAGFALTDVSRHGTFVIEGTRLRRLEKGSATPLRRPTRLRLAKEIELDIEPL